MATRYQDVVCAFLLADEEEEQGEAIRLLCAQRYADAEHFPDLYEFPGGKVDEGESHAQALRRECREELGIEVELLGGDKEAAGPCYTFSHQPKADSRLGGMVVFRLFFYWAKRTFANRSDAQKSEPQALASQRVVWLTPQEMAQHVFCPGDEGIIDALNAGTLRPPSAQL